MEYPPCLPGRDVPDHYCPRCGQTLGRRLRLFCPNCLHRTSRLREPWEGHTDGCSAGRLPTGARPLKDRCSECGSLMKPDE